MTTNELMRGDWVKFGDNIMKVTSITENWVSVERKDGFSLTFSSIKEMRDVKLSFDLEDLEPIPLTKEILEKNGFVEESTYTGPQSLLYSGLADTDNLWVVVSGDGYFEGEIEYVHQLQHVLRVCGVNREVEI